ncbi:MAG TPA: SusD/RagB family nutrient-binding outer membrane lipoprotein, partial [Flavisolibacter sp.]|nr:SusD/RagB family nutrient-binding outer membrane lipoprotein [Flavisolibacter sp.]
VRESFRLLGVPNADARATALLTSGIADADWTASTDKLHAIWMQKWLALVNFGGLEAWTEYRRTNYPPIPESAGASAGAAVPVRLYYPNTEVGANSNTPKQATDVVFKNRLFWDVD